jgi:hypothetical protein
MKLVKNFGLAVLLAFFLAISAPAGEVPMPGALPTPTPQGARSSDDSYSDPDATDVTAETSDYLFFEALAALLSVY